MRIDNLATDEAVLGELARRLSRARLERNLTQAQVGAQAGVERKTVLRLEAGESVDLSSLIRVLRALDLIDGLNLLVPEASPSPFEQLKLHGRERRRARPRMAAPAPPVSRPWRWGDERS